MLGWLIILVVALVIGAIGSSLYVNGTWQTEDLGITLGAVSLVCLIVTVPILIFTPLSIKSEIVTFEQNRTIIEQIIAQGDEYDNMAITQTLIEANSWLAQARAQKEIFGIFSFYKPYDLDSIKPISLPPTVAP